MKKIILMFVIIVGSVAFAEDVKNPIVSLLVDEYFKNHKSPFHEECRVPGVGCIDAVCNYLGARGCDEKNEIDEVLKMCRGNFDGECLDVACKNLGTFGCNDVNEVQEIARACVGNFGGECVFTVCQRLGSFGCDERSEVIDVINKCAGN